MAKKTQKRMPRRREEFTYRGYSIDDLQQMALSELLPLMPSRGTQEVRARPLPGTREAPL